MFFINNSEILNGNLDKVFKDFLKNIFQEIFKQDKNKIKKYYDYVINRNNDGIDETLTITPIQILSQKFKFFCQENKYKNDYNNYEKFIIDHEYGKYLLQSAYSYFAFIKRNSNISNSFVLINEKSMYIYINFSDLPRIPKDVFIFFKNFICLEIKENLCKCLNKKPSINLTDKIYYLEFSYFIQHPNDFIGDWIKDEIIKVKGQTPLFCLFGDNLKHNYLITIYSFYNIDVIYKIEKDNLEFVSNFIEGIIINTKFDYIKVKTVEDLYPQEIKYEIDLLKNVEKMNYINI